MSASIYPMSPSSIFNELVAKTLPFVPKPIVRWASKPYVAGELIDDAANMVRQLNAQGVVATIDCLGEFVTQRSQAVEATQMSHSILEAIQKSSLKSGLSVKLTSLGLDIDDEFCYANVRSLVERAREIDRFVRIDMENSPYTTRTLNLYRRLKNEKLDNLGVVIQAYMRRSEDDIRSLTPFKTPVRLCKGIYREDESIAFKGRTEVQENFKKLLVILFESGMHAAIATHDDVLLDFAREHIAKHSIDKSRYEFQMLLGVREQKRAEIVREGHRVRVYVPFGKDWYGYSLRRLKENPEVAGHIIRAFFRGE